MVSTETPRRGIVLMRRVAWMLVVLCGAIGGGLYIARQWRAPPEEADMRAAYAAAVGGPFQLVDTQGRSFTNEKLKGQPFAIFFGFTNCPEVCPITLNELSLLRGDVGKAADRLRVVFVTVDPERDSPEKIDQYLKAFDMPAIGLTGSAEQIARAVKAYGVYARKVPVEGADYTMDHTATVFLMDRDGKFFGSLAMGEPYETKLKKMQRFLRNA